MNKKVISKITSGVLLCTMLAYTTPVLAFTKDETVYSKIDSNGNNYNTIVNDHIIKRTFFFISRQTPYISFFAL